MSESQPTATIVTTLRGTCAGVVNALNHLKYDNFQQQMRHLSDENEHVCLMFSSHVQAHSKNTEYKKSKTQGIKQEKATSHAQHICRASH